MKNSSVGIKVSIPTIFVQQNDQNLLIPSMVLTTMLTCTLITFIPQLMPLWMQLATVSSK